MINKILSTTMLCACAAIMASAASPASAHGGHGGHGGVHVGGLSLGVGHGGPVHWHRRVYVAGPAYVVGSGCGWLRDRAVATGSNYWWARYRACLG